MSERKIRVQAEWRDEPDWSKLAQALLLLAIARAEATDKPSDTTGAPPRQEAS